MTDINLFDYDLPQELIAQRPADKRDESRLLVLNRSTRSISHSNFRAFPDLLREGDLLVLNITKVFPARLIAKRKTGGAVELLLVRSRGDGVWDAVTGGLAKLKPGEELNVGDGTASLVEKLEGGMARYKFDSEAEVQRLTQKFGAVPLPPYIKRVGESPDAGDRERYQTVFAKNTGSSAAPTAGLHFTDETLGAIRAKGVQTANVILHVGPGTFKPVKSESIEDHVMDPEPFEIPADTAAAVNAAKAEGRRVIAVGSTVTRTLENAANENGSIKPGAGETGLYITPGHKFKTVNALLTNFHLPKSTLLILVSAFADRELILKAYEEAVQERYRFFSYGDAMFIE